MNDTQTIEAYQAPAVTSYGPVADLTAGTSDGNNLDATFPVNTPRGQLTFS